MIPNELVQGLIDFCKKDGRGFLNLGDRSIGLDIIVMGPVELSIDQVSIISAHMLLNGVITGELMTGNKDAADSLKKENVN